jgi:cytochrome c oxidase subunit 3
VSEQHFSPELNAKVKKNLLRYFMFTVTMIFAGLTSAYIVSMGEYFWVNVPMPKAFMISTTCILVSSAFLFLAVRAVKKNQTGILKIASGAALILGSAFGYYQFVGWGQLVDNGAPLVSDILNQLGPYGKYYSYTYKGHEITYDNNKYYWRGEQLEEPVYDQMKDLSRQLNEGSLLVKNNYKLTNYGTDFMLMYQGVPVSYVNNKLYYAEYEFDKAMEYQLRHFTKAIIEGYGDFYMKGEYGKDFQVYYKGDPLTYENRTFYRNGKVLTPAQLDDLNTQKNTAGSYIYAFSGVHFLHWVGGIIALLVVFIKSLNNRYSQANYLGLTLGASYWHFLGIIWLYLYFFLIYIH